MSRLLLTALVLATLPAVHAQPDDDGAEGATLYQRLGGYDALAAVTDAFVVRLATDEQLGRFFTGHGTASQQRIRQLVVDQLCAATGGPCVYIGRDMRATHAGMGITEADWDRSVEHLVATLDQFAVPAREKDELLAIVGPLKDEIVDTASAMGR
jgi:hemoglobin